jgi:hypothetical protein
MSSSRRHSGRRRPSKGNKLAKNNNITLLKLLDPVVQSVLIVLFLYCIDDEKLFPYRIIFFILLIWQAVSALLNFLLTGMKLLTNERTIYLATMCIYMLFFFFFERHVKEHFVAFDEISKPNIPLYRLITMTIAMAIAFWYNLICYREIRTMLSGVVNRGRGRD